MSEFNLDAFLAARQAEGVSQGEGGFTISHDKARAKMTRYSLPREYSWVLKLVQAGVGWSCQRISVRQTRTESLFAFGHDDPTTLPGSEELVSALLRSDFDSDDALDRFGTALRILVERAHLSFLLQIHRGGDPQAIYAGAYFSEMGESKRTKMRAEWGPGLTLAIHHISHTEPNRLLLDFIPMKRHGLPMLCELEEYAYLSPVPIRVDGRWIDGALRSSVLNWCNHRKPLKIGALPARNVPNLALAEGFGEREFTVRTTLRRANRKSYEKTEAPAYVIMAIELESAPYEVMNMEPRSCFHWVCDGVIVQTSRLLPTKNLAIQIYANAAGLKTDLTSFHLVDDEVYRARRAQVYGAVAAVLSKELERERDIFEDDEDERSAQDAEIELEELKQQRRKLAGRVALGSVVMAPLTGPLAPGTILTGLAASAYVASRRVKRPEVNWEISLVSKRYLKEIEDMIVFCKKNADPDEE